VPSQPFRAEVSWGVARVTITLSGDINVNAADGLAAAYADAAARGAQLIVLDFSGSGYINSTGIALIVRLLADARGAGREVHAAGLSPHYTEIFRITRLSDHMHIEDADANVATQGPAAATGGDR